MSERLKVAIVGAGIGREHFAAYQQLTDRYEVVAVCDANPERAQACVAGYNTPVVTEVDGLYADESVDLIDVCLPPHLHFDFACQALKSGKHVICEKPLVASLEQADQLIELARDCDRKLYPVFQYRYGRALCQLRALMQAGLCGRAYVGSLETHWNRSAEYYAEPWRGTWQGERGGAVLGHAIHNHDLITHLLGPVDRVSAYVATRVNDIETEDCAAIQLQMKSGALVTSSVTLGAASDTTRLRLCFEKLTAESGSEPYAPATDQWRFIARDPDDQVGIDKVVDSVSCQADGYVGLFTAIADDLAGQVASVVTAQDGRRSIELVSAIYLSAKKRLPVDLPMDERSNYYSGWMPV